MSNQQQIEFHRRIKIFFFPSLCIGSIFVSTLSSGVMAERSPEILLATSQNLDYISETVASPLEQGKIFYQHGQIQQAIATWENALKTYQNKQDLVKQIQTLNFLASAYQDLGNIKLSQDKINISLQLLKSIPRSNKQTNLLSAQALNNQGMTRLLSGQTQDALLSWEQATKVYQDNQDSIGATTAQINQAQALQTLGQYRKAKDVLEKSISSLKNSNDDILKAKALNSLGVALQNLGEPTASKEVLEESWTISSNLKSEPEISSVLFNLGNVAKDLQGYDAAWQYYEKSLDLAQDPLSRLEIELNQLRLLVQFNKLPEIDHLIPNIEKDLNSLAPSRDKIYASINLAESLIRISQIKSNGDNDISKIVIYQKPDRIITLLKTAVDEAKRINDTRAEAYSFYQLGKLYHVFKNLPEAQKITAKGFDLAQSINADDILARTSSQLATILKEEGNFPEAIANYEIAFKQLQKLRRDLVAVNPDVQFEFKQNIEPIYRDYVDVLLRGDSSQAYLKQAREVMEALQLAELDDYFRDACLDVHPVNLDQVDDEAAIIYPIQLKDRLETILALPNQPLKKLTSAVTQEEIESKLSRFYSSFSPGYPRDRHWRFSKEFYGWLIAPIEAELAKSQIKTLVFIPDTVFRNIPMAALYDGKQYLVQKYSIAVSPGLQLFPEGKNQQKNNVFAGGLSEARQGFDSLPGVNEELKTISDRSNTEVLLNQKFTKKNLVDIINNQSFPFVHLATHGQFSSDPNRTFLLTWDDKISVNDFDRMFEKRRLGILDPIELLVMSACQTASGDDRAVLGLSGFALRSGARSTLGSLWPVSDESTSALMLEFYDQLLNHHVTKAEALRQAQLKLLQNPLYEHPYFWSAFILVGNWL